jgi:hypothetical protein
VFQKRTVFKWKDTNKKDIAVGFDNENTLWLSEEWIDRGEELNLD